MDVRKGAHRQQISLAKAFFSGVTFSLVLLVFVLGGRNLFVSVLNAISSGTVSAISAISGFWDTVASFTRQIFQTQQLNREIKRLYSQLAELQAESWYLKELTEENQRLRRLLGLVQSLNRPYTGAEVVAIGGSNWFQTLIINKGSEDGIPQGAPVLCHKGLVGRVMEVRAHHSIVLLVTDRHSAVGVSLTKHESVYGILKGTGSRFCELVHLSRHAVPKKGETLVTSGLGGVFPKGIPVGEVVSVKTDTEPPTVKVRPLFHLDELREVIVLTDLPPTISQ